MLYSIVKLFSSTSVEYLLKVSLACTPSVPKLLSSFLIMARLRPAHHCPSSSEYATKNRKQQLLRNTPKSCSVASLLDDDLDS